MHERQIEERPHRQVCRLIKAARQGAISDSARQRIGRKGARTAAKHVARKLIQQKHKRERTLCVLCPGRKLASCGRLVDREKPRSDGLVETFVLREPFVASSFTPEGYDLCGRNTNRHLCGSPKRKRHLHHSTVTAPCLESAQSIRALAAAFPRHERGARRNPAGR